MQFVQIKWKMVTWWVVLFEYNYCCCHGGDCNVLHKSLLHCFTLLLHPLKWPSGAVVTLSFVCQNVMKRGLGDIQINLRLNCQWLWRYGVWHQDSNLLIDEVSLLVTLSRPMVESKVVCVIVVRWQSDGDNKSCLRSVHEIFLWIDQILSAYVPLS